MRAGGVLTNDEILGETDNGGGCEGHAVQRKSRSVGPVEAGVMQHQDQQTTDTEIKWTAEGNDPIKTLKWKIKSDVMITARFIIKCCLQYEKVFHTNDLTHNQP